jgi:hypothetical protein
MEPLEFNNIYIYINRYIYMKRIKVLNKENIYKMYFFDTTVYIHQE